jgi:hypothetical protein
MAQIANIVLNDGQSTPVAHTFAPVTSHDTNGVAVWTDRASGIAVGFPVISFRLRDPLKGSRAYRLTAKIRVPVLDVTSPSTGTGIQPAPSVAYACEANIEFILPERSVLQNRKDILAYAVGLMGNAAVMKAAVETYEQVF